jgi:hypothetical protein
MVTRGQHERQIVRFRSHLDSLALDIDVTRQIAPVVGWSMIQHAVEAWHGSQSAQPGRLPHETWADFHTRLILQNFSRQAHRDAKRLRRWRHNALYECKIPSYVMADRLRLATVATVSEILRSSGTSK